MNKLLLLPVLVAILSMTPALPERSVDDPYTAYHSNGTKKFTVSFRKNKLTGDWKSWYASGSICDSGRFVGNVPDGEWKGWYPDGSTRYKWHVSASKLKSLKDEILRQPKMRMFDISRKPVREAVKYYQADYLFRQPVERNGIAFRSQLVNAKAYDLPTIEKKVDHNTVKKDSYLPPFPEMLLHGEFTSYYPGGKLKEEGIYLNGLREGVWEEVLPDGKRNRGTYHHGFRSGEWRTYDSNGKLLSYSHYKSNGDVSETHEFGKRRY